MILFSILLALKIIMQKHSIICAIDFSDIKYAYNLVKKLKWKVFAIKLGLEFFIANGIEGVKKIEEIGIPIFLDLKLHDIPNTVAKSINILKHLNLCMLTIHISGGAQMMQMVVNALNDTKVKIIGVTMLTSLANDDLLKMGFDNKTIDEHVINLSRLALRSGLDGVVCSGHEITGIKRSFGKDFIVVVPGIRLSDENNDQKRIMTPVQAMNLGADYLVIGREITNSNDPIGMVSQINEEINTC